MSKKDRVNFDIIDDDTSQIIKNIDTILEESIEISENSSTV